MCFASVEASIVAMSASPTPGISPPRRLTRSSLRVVEFHRFLMALSVLPGISFTIKAHFVPCSATARMICRSSSNEKDSFFTSGERWLCHRSRHCFPTRLGRCSAIRLQLDGPYCCIKSSSSVSSSCDHACLRTVGPVTASASASPSPCELSPCTLSPSAQGAVTGVACSSSVSGAVDCGMAHVRSHADKTADRSILSPCETPRRERSACVESACAGVEWGRA
mmetsp:Transcript_9956/g.24652  ORF Transcript_9956/g.24652 Transcript_9956/m.24652 type:complete len:223 (+) Transcript_9956:552-1220(+)